MNIDITIKNIQEDELPTIQKMLGLINVKSTYCEDTVKRDENLTLEELDLGRKISNILKKENILTLGDIIEYKGDELLKLEGMGMSSLKEIKKAIGARGYILRKY